MKHDFHGVVEGMPSEFYHSITDHLSYSYLARLRAFPGASQIWPSQTPAMVRGEAVHVLALEGWDEFNQRFCQAPKGDKRTKEGKAIFASFEEEAGDRHILTFDEYVTISNMADAVHAHPKAHEILQYGKSEVSYFWEDQSGLKAKARMDWSAGDILADLKTTRSSDPRQFLKSIIEFGYYIQAAFYLDGYEICTGHRPEEFLFIAVESDAPHRVEVYDLDTEFIKYGKLQARKLINLDMECRAKGEYPNYSSPDIQRLFKPEYL